MAYCLCVCACLALPVLCVCMCAHMKGCKYSSENPIKGDMYWFAVLFKAFWDISMDISFNVRPNGRKQTNLLLPSFLSLFPLFHLFSSLSVTLHQSLSCVLLSVSSLFSSRCVCKMQHCPKNHSSFCPSPPCAP